MPKDSKNKHKIALIDHYKKELLKLVQQSIHAKDNNFSGVFAFLKHNKLNAKDIVWLSKLLVVSRIVDIVLPNDCNHHKAPRQYEILVEQNPNAPPPFVDADAFREFQKVGRTELGLYVGSEQHVHILYVKTTLFKTLLIAEAGIIAYRMLELAPEGDFNYNGDPLATPAIILAAPKKTQIAIAKKLVARNDFSLSMCDTDRLGNCELFSVLEKLSILKNKNSKLLLSHMLQNPRLNFNSLVPVHNFVAFEQATPLMLYAYHGNIEAVKLLIQHGVDVSASTEPKSCHGKEKFNAISFAGVHLDIIELLINNGCPYLGNFVNLFGRLPKKSTDKMILHAEKIQQLCIARAYCEKATTLFETTSEYNSEQFIKEAKDIVVQQKNLLDVQRQQPTPEIVEPELANILDVETLLLEYFSVVNDDEKLAIKEKINELCSDFPEVLMQLIATLNKNYLNYPNIDSYVHDLLSSPKEVHQYFKHRKTIIQNLMVESYTEKHIAQQKIWKINDDEFIRFDQATPIATTMVNKLFVNISESLFKEYSLLLRSGMQNLKVIGRESEEINGIKIFTHKGIVALKTKALGDIRLLAQGFYRNDDGDILFHFNRSTNHLELGQILSSSSNSFLPLSSIDHRSIDHRNKKQTENSTCAVKEGRSDMSSNNLLFAPKNHM